MKKKGKDLIFISRIKRDGSGVEPIDEETQKQLQGDEFEKYRITGLSISNKTLIASGFNCYVVRLRK